MKVIEYTVTYRYPGETQQEEVFYTKEAAVSKAKEVELWGGVAVITDDVVEEEDLNGPH